MTLEVSGIGLVSLIVVGALGVLCCLAMVTAVVLVVVWAVRNGRQS